MDPLRFSVFWNVALPAAAWLGFAFSLAGLALGAALLLRSGETLAWLRSMNRWVSTRRALKPLEIPHPADQTLERHSRLLSMALVAGGVFVVVVLVAGYPDARAVFRLEALRVSPSAVAASIAIESAYLLLIAGGALAIAAGMLLGLFPNAWRALEAGANRWVSARRVVAGASAMHFTLDSLAEAHPRAAGWLIAAGSLVASVAFGVLAYALG